MIFSCVSVRQRLWHRSATWGLTAVLPVRRWKLTTCMKTATMRMRWQWEWRLRDTSDKDSTSSPTARNSDLPGKNQSVSPLPLCMLFAGHGSSLSLCPRLSLALSAGCIQLRWAHTLIGQWSFAWLVVRMFRNSFNLAYYCYLGRHRSRLKNLCEKATGHNVFRRSSLKFFILGYLMNLKEPYSVCAIAHPSTLNQEFRMVKPAEMLGLLFWLRDLWYTFILA